MRRTIATWVLASSGMVLGLSGCHGAGVAEPAPSARAEPAVEPGRYLADFDRAWELVRDTHYDTTYNGVDWDAVRVELRPQAEAATTRDENRMIIQEMVGRLNQSHFGVIPDDIDLTGEDDDSSADTDGDADAVGDGDGPSGPVEVAGRGDGQGTAMPGLDFRVVDGRVLVTSVLPGGPADKAGVRMGWVLEKIRARDMGAMVERLSEAVGASEAALYASQAISERLRGRSGTPIEMTFLDGDDAEVVVEVVRAEPPGSFVKFGNLPPMSTNLDHRWLTDAETGDPDARIGYIAFNIFMIPIAPQFERAMVELQDADGIVIDLRGNPGGVGMMASALSRFLVSEPAQLGTMTMRGAELEFNAEPVVVTSLGERLSPFAGPVAMVIDGTSASTSEVWAGGLRAIGRVRTFGSRSAGMALPAAMDRLPSGDVFLHAIADYVNSDGTRLEGDGVPADVSVPVRRDDLLAGVDAPLREAAQWIVNETATAAGGPAGTN